MFKISVDAAEIEKLPVGTFPGEIKIIDKPGLEYEKAIFYLRRQKIIGFDTESRPVFSPGQHNHGVALLQLSGPRNAYLFRIQLLGMKRSLCSVLSNKNIIKVGAAVMDDLRGLQRLRSFSPAGFVDLQKIAWEWGIRDKSVKKLAANILECRISKAQQLSNWEAEILSPSQCKYAATDAWVCREMYLKLLECEKHPLSPEEMLPPQDMLAHKAAVERKEANIAAEKARAGTSKRKRHRHKKKKTENGKDNTEEGQR
ncbi:MAG: 3'-5' exonuclease domain-containing protein 2 [Bacteroidales bacterium]|nr:3'-5' exonuclease domain-containing protein 2 [Bacteroidales bacterium]